MNKVSVCLLGGSGFLGRSLIEAGREHPRFQWILADSQRPDFDLKGVEFRMVDILDKPTIRSSLQDVGVVINFVGQITSPISLCEDLNSLGALNLAQSIGENQRLFHISTVAVYGTSKSVNEESSLRPESSYALAKVTAEKIFQDSCAPSNLAILRLPNMYGPFQKRGVLAYLLRSFRSDRILDFDHDGSMLRFYLHSEDFSQILLDLLEVRAHGVFNLPGEGPLSIRALVEHAELSLNSQFQTNYQPMAPKENIQQLGWDRLSQKISFHLRWSIEKYLKHQLC